MFLYIILLIAVGCTPQVQQPVAPDGVKFSELIPAAVDEEKNTTIISFNVYVFGVPAVNYNSVKQALKPLSDRPINFADAEAFFANGLSAGFGRGDMWDKISEQMRNSGAKTLNTSAVTFGRSSNHDISVAKFTRDVQLFYHSFDKAFFSSTFDSGGEGLLRLNALPVPAVRGLCRLDIEPVFISSANSEFIFSASALNVHMSPGEYILIWPGKAYMDGMTLSKAFLTSSGPRAAVKVCLIACSEIEE